MIYVFVCAIMSCKINALLKFYSQFNWPIWHALDMGIKWPTLFPSYEGRQEWKGIWFQ